MALSLSQLTLAAEYGDQARKCVAWGMPGRAYDTARWAAHLALLGCDYLAEDEVRRSMLDRLSEVRP